MKKHQACVIIILSSTLILEKMMKSKAPSNLEQRAYKMFEENISVMSKLHRAHLAGKKLTHEQLKRFRKAYELFEKSCKFLQKNGADSELLEEINDAREIVEQRLTDLGLVTPLPPKEESLVVRKKSPKVEDRFILLPTAKRTLVEEKVKKIQDLLQEMVDTFKERKALGTDDLKNIIKKFGRAFVKFQASSKDKAAFDKLRSEYKKILTEGKEVLSNMKDPLVTRLYNSLIHVLQTFFGWLDKLQSSVRGTKTYASQPGRKNWFNKEEPVKDVKKALDKFDAALGEFHEVVEEIKLKVPSSGSRALRN